MPRLNFPPTEKISIISSGGLTSEHLSSLLYTSMALNTWSYFILVCCVWLMSLGGLIFSGEDRNGNGFAGEGGKRMWHVLGKMEAVGAVGGMY